MEFNVDCDGSKVALLIEIDCGRAGPFDVRFEHTLEDEALAGLLAEAVEKQFVEHITQIREAAYNEGWDDNRRRKKKREFFSFCPATISMRARL